MAETYKKQNKKLSYMLHLVFKKPAGPTGVDNDVSGRPSNLSSASRYLELWPSDSQSWVFYALAPRTTCVNWHRNRFTRFQNIVFTIWSQTNERINWEHYASVCQSGLEEA